MIKTREYNLLQYETSMSLENITTDMTMFTNSTITVLPNGLSDGAIAGIVIGTILGIIGLILFAFIIYKYRQRFLNILNRNSKKSDDRSISETMNNPRPNITYSPEHEYLTVNTSSSLKNQQSDERSNKQPTYENFSQ